VVSSTTTRQPARAATSASAARTRGGRRVLEVGHQVRGARAGLAQGRLGGGDVPAVLDRQRDRAATSAPDDVQGQRVGRALHQHPVAGGQQDGEQQPQPVDRAGRHQHLGRVGGQAALGVAAGDPAAQPVQPRRDVAVAG
jgi:hypothetical protein